MSLKIILAFLQVRFCCNSRIKTTLLGATKICTQYPQSFLKSHWSKQLAVFDEEIFSVSFFKVREFPRSRYRTTRCHNFQFEKHVCEILSRVFSSSFSRVFSAHNEEIFSNITILCCRERRKTDKRSSFHSRATHVFADRQQRSSNCFSKVS